MGVWGWYTKVWGWYTEVWGWYTEVWGWYMEDRLPDCLQLIRCFLR